MAAMACNHLWMNFASRLSTYLKIVHPRITKGFRKVVVDCVAVFPKAALSKVPKLSLKTEKGKVMGDGRRRAITEAIDLIKALRKRCPLNTVGNAFLAHKLLPLHLDMMVHIEAAYAATRAEEIVDVKRARLLRRARFSLLPNKSGFTVSSIPICGRALMNVLTRVRDAKGVPLAKFKGKEDGHDAAWRKHFNVNKVETSEREFGGRISTDGVAVTVHLRREQACILSRTNGEWDAKRIKRENTGRLPVLYAGIDPGVTDVVTVARTTELNGLKDGADKSVPAKVKSYSASRYAEASKQKASNRRTAVWNRETDDAILLDTQSDRSTSLGYQSFVKSYLATFRTLLEHRAKRGYRTMRFMRYVFKQRAIAEICDLIAPDGYYTVAGYGDWRGLNGTPIKRRWSGPQEEIRRALQRRRNVLFWNMWEYKTSVTCHETWRRLTNMRAKTTRYDRATKSMVPGEKRSSVHKVLHCRSSDGVKGRHGGGTWNRDANASRNMVMLMMLVVLGVERPREFMPAEQASRRPKQGRTEESSNPAKSLSLAHLGAEGR